MTGPKLTILDGISGVPLGQEIHQAFANEGITSVYADLKKFKTKKFYSLKAGVIKTLNKRQNSDSFYHFPRIDESAFESFIKQQAPTSILIIGFLYKFLNPTFIREIKQKYNVSIFLYDTDSCNLYSKRREFIFFLETELPIYDEIFSFSKVTTRFFNDTKYLKTSFLPFGAKKLEIKPNISPKHDVLFVGSCDLRRIFLLESIKEKVTVYGDRWGRNYPLISDELKEKVIDKSLWGEELYQMLSDSKIVLNITRSPFYGAETGVNLRIFEALSAGCFLLTDYCEELTELFVVGEEIEVFRNATELKEKVNFYLHHPNERNKIARQGQEKFLKEYTWEIWVKKFSKKINLA